MSGQDHRKASLYFPEDMIREIEREARRLDRSQSWLMQQAWRYAREKIFALPEQEVM